MLLQTLNDEGSLGRQLEIENFLANVSIGVSNCNLRRIGASNRNVGKSKFQFQVVYQRELSHFKSTSMHDCVFSWMTDILSGCKGWKGLIIGHEP